MIRKYVAEDWPEWFRMRLALWPDSTEHDAEAWLTRTDTATLVAQRADGSGLCGFAEVGERPYADGCDSSPVAFLEGWFVDQDERGKGLGAALIAGAENWASERGLHEFASDSLLEDTDAHAAHLRVGFLEVERAIKYRKLLRPVSS